MNPCRFEAVWFDLDGTLLETAPDLINAVNATLVSRGLNPLPYEIIRQHISCGSRAMMALGLGVEKEDCQVDELVPIFSEYYAAHVCEKTTWFAGMEKIIQKLEENHIPWGIITNKAEKFAVPLIEQFGLKNRIAALVCGDTCSRSKPSPEPLFHAAEISRTTPEKSVFIGDNIVDIQAGKAAKMYTVAAAYGYVHADADPQQWGADAIANNLAELEKILFVPEK